MSSVRQARSIFTETGDSELPGLHPALKARFVHGGEIAPRDQILTKLAAPDRRNAVVS